MYTVMSVIVRLRGDIAVVLTAFLEAGQTFLLGHAAADAGGLTGPAGQGVEAAQRAEL